MTSEQLDFINKTLEQRRQDLQKVLASNEDIFRQKTQADITGDTHIDFNHPADMMAGDADYEKELRLIETEQRELHLVQEALIRLHEGRFGICHNCSEEIPFPRLKAVPYTKYCLACQTAQDRHTTLHS